MWKLYKTAPDMIPFLIDIFTDKYRIIMLQKLAIGCLHVKVSLSCLPSALNMEDVNEVRQWLAGKSNILNFRYQVCG